MYVIKENEIVYIDYKDREIVLEGADPDTFEVLEDKTLTESDLDILGIKRNNYALGKAHLAAKDKNSVWTREVKIPDADPDTFEFYFGGQCTWGQDKNSGYCFYYYGKNRIKPIKLKGRLQFFEDRIGGYMRMYAFDDRYVYYYGRRCRGSVSAGSRYLIQEDVQIDTLTGDMYDDLDSMISNNTVYYYGKVLEGADAGTAKGFSIDDPMQGSLYIIIDRNTIFHSGRVFAPSSNRYQYARIPQVLFDWQSALQDH